MTVVDIKSMSLGIGMKAYDMMATIEEVKDLFPTESHNTQEKYCISGSAHHSFIRPIDRYGTSGYATLVYAIYFCEIERAFPIKLEDYRKDWYAQ